MTLECVGDSRISHVQLAALELLAALLALLLAGKCLTEDMRASTRTALEAVAASGKNSVLKAKAEAVLSQL